MTNFPDIVKYCIQDFQNSLHEENGDFTLPDREHGAAGVVSHRVRWSRGTLGVEFFQI